MFDKIKKYKGFLVIGGGVVFVFMLTYVLSLYYPITSSNGNELGDSSLSKETTVNVDGIKNKEVMEHVQPFMLGTKEFNSVNGNRLPVELKGKIALPTTEGELPIVFILPSPLSTLYDDNDYEALLTTIAKQNCVAIYLDMAEILAQKQVDFNLVKEIFNAYRDELNAIMLGEKSTAGLELMNKASFSKVVMVGFEESVDAIYAISENQMSEQQLNLESLLLVNPKKQEATHYSYPDILTSFLIDNTQPDVETLPSLQLFEEYRQEKARQSLTSYTIIESNLEECDTDDTKSDSSTKKQESVQHGGDASFLLDFIVDFLDATFNQESNTQIFSVTSALPETLYEKKVRSALLVPNTLRLINPFIEDKPTLNTLGGSNVGTHLKMDYVKADISIFKLNIEKTPATLSIHIPEEFKNLSRYDSISMYMSVCTNNESTSTQKTAISMSLIDESGKTASVNEETYLSLCDAKHGYHLSDERFILSQFTEVDLKAITQIKVEFKDEFIQNIVLGDVSLVKQSNE